MATVVVVVGAVVVVVVGGEVVEVDVVDEEVVLDVEVEEASVVVGDVDVVGTVFGGRDELEELLELDDEELDDVLELELELEIELEVEDTLTVVGTGTRETVGGAVVTVRIGMYSEFDLVPLGHVFSLRHVTDLFEVFTHVGKIPFIANADADVYADEHVMPRGYITVPAGSFTQIF